MAQTTENISSNIFSIVACAFFRRCLKLGLHVTVGRALKWRLRFCFLGSYLLLQNYSNNKALKREWLMSQPQVVKQAVLCNFTCYNVSSNSDGHYSSSICLQRTRISRNSKQIPLKCELDMIPRQRNLDGAQLFSETGTLFCLVTAVYGWGW
jgi:hypothetical protein